MSFGTLLKVVSRTAAFGVFCCGSLIHYQAKIEHYHIHNFNYRNLKNVPNTLITSGVYQQSRNPIYLSYIMITASIPCVLFTSHMIPSLLLFLVCGLIWKYFDKGIIPMEEILLKKKFGKDYIEYQQNVHRWIPFDRKQVMSGLNH